MKNNLIFIILGPWFAILLFMGQHQERENNFATKDTIPPKTDTIIVKTCRDCHADLFSYKIKHTTETGKDCEDCHKSNGGEHPKKGVVAFSLTDTLPNLCLSCHKEIKDIYANSRIVHHAIDNKKSCVYCHSPHSSSEKQLLVASRKEVCLSCHNKTITTPTVTLDNIDQIDKKGKVFHPPFRKCSKACHNPHGSDNFRALNNTFPDDEYAPGNIESFALCFGCHKASLIEAPISTAATNFRNGDRNLHFVHVNKDKGRKCTFCHSPHATTNLHLIRDDAKFGNLVFKLNYKADSTGGSCAPGCHVERRYTR